MKTAFLGLGVMGYPMAGHLLAGGHEVVVYNRNPDRAAQWVEQYGASSAPTPAAAVQGAQIVFACVGRDEDIWQVACGDDGALAAMDSGSVFVDHTTTSAKMAVQLAERAKQLGLGFIDAPVSGGQAGADNGVLTVMAGGEEADWARASDVIGCYARTMKLLGPAGSGQLSKMVNQICIAGLVQGLAEGVHFAEQAGLDPAAVFEVIGGGAAQSWQMDNRAKTMAAREFDFGFAVEWMRKDLGYALDAARDNGASLPVTTLVDNFYAEVEAMGGSRWDTSSLLQRLDRGNK